MASRGAASSEHLERLHDIFRALHADLGGAAQRLRHGAAGGCCRGGRPGTGRGCGPQRPRAAPSGPASPHGATAGQGQGQGESPGAALGPRAAPRSWKPCEGARNGTHRPGRHCAEEPGRSLCWCSGARSGLPGAVLRSGKELGAVGSHRLLTGSVFSVLVGFSTNDCKPVLSHAVKW